METSVLYYLMRLYDLYADKQQNIPADKQNLIEKIKLCTDKQIIETAAEKIPELDTLDFKKEADINRLCEILKPYADKCRSLLPSLEKESQLFSDTLANSLCEQGYFLKDGVFRKVRKNRLYLIEASLATDFISSDSGYVTGVMVFPIVRVAEAKLKINRQKQYVTECGLSDDEVTFSDIKLFCPSAFYRTLRHLETASLEVGENVSRESVDAIIKSAEVAASVCENKAIPSYYKKLCKNDFPIKKAILISAISFISSFVLSTLFIGIFSGLAVYFTLGYKNVLGLFSVSQFYLVTLIISLVYSIIAFNKTRSGRF